MADIGTNHEPPLIEHVQHQHLVRLLDDFFFFSSRRRHTRLTCDWSSDVCSSDLDGILYVVVAEAIRVSHDGRQDPRWNERSEERRVGKECRSWWSQYH